MLAYTNLEACDSIEDVSATEWRRGPATRNTSAKQLSAEKKTASSVEK